MSETEQTSVDEIFDFKDADAPEKDRVRRVVFPDIFLVEKEEPFLRTEAVDEDEIQIPAL